jgi:acyl transferase domain-containing protein/acyl carrier protein
MLDSDALTPETPLMEAGMDSLASVSMRNELQKHFSMQLPATITMDHPTLSSIVSFIRPDDAPPPVAPEGCARNVSDLTVSVTSEAGQFPGMACNPEAFLASCFAGCDGSVEIPLALWDVAEFFDPAGANAAGAIAGTVYTKHGSFIEGVQYFDPRLFRIAAGEARIMDPHQRMSLRVAYEAYLERDAKHLPKDVIVSVGQCCNDWMTIPQKMGPFSGTGLASCINANRISFVFGLTGASLVVDTACSSSLVSIELAVKKIRDGTSAHALALGVHLMLGIGAYPAFCISHMLSFVGRCLTFDASADGY